VAGRPCRRHRPNGAFARERWAVPTATDFSRRRPPRSHPPAPCRPPTRLPWPRSQCRGQGCPSPVAIVRLSRGSCLPARSSRPSTRDPARQGTWHPASSTSLPPIGASRVQPEIDGPPRNYSARRRRFRSPRCVAAAAPCPRVRVYRGKPLRHTGLTLAPRPLARREILGTSDVTPPTPNAGLSRSSLPCIY
jgi:hypothetical protein